MKVYEFDDRRARFVHLVDQLQGAIASPWRTAMPGGPGVSPSALVVGHRDEIGVALRAALEREEVVIAAPALAGETAAHRGPGGVDRASPCLGVEEAADAAEVRVRLAPHDSLVTPRGSGVTALAIVD